LKDPAPTPVLGDRIEFRAGVVPLSLRAEWERADAKIIPFDTEAWIEEHKNEYRVQSMAAIGNGIMRLDQTFSDPVLGLCELMEQTAAKIREKHKELNEPSKKIIS
jgi:hypothetical protein